MLAQRTLSQLMNNMQVDQLILVCQHVEVAALRFFGSNGWSTARRIGLSLGLSVFSWLLEHGLISNSLSVVCVIRGLILLR
jgi:hypothetical protein